MKLKRKEIIGVIIGILVGLIIYSSYSYFHGTRISLYLNLTVICIMGLVSGFITVYIINAKDLKQTFSLSIKTGFLLYILTIFYQLYDESKHLCSYWDPFNELVFAAVICAVFMIPLIVFVIIGGTLNYYIKKMLIKK